MSDPNEMNTVAYRHRIDKRKIGFMDLPGEIRNKIYRILLVVPPVYERRKLGSDERVYPLPLLLLCQQVHSEAIDFLYGENTFIAHPSLLCSMPRLRHYYGTIRSNFYTSLIKRYEVRVRLDCDPQFTAQQACSAFDSCERLNIEPWQAQFESCDFHILKLFEEIRGVKKATVSSRTESFSEYATWLEKSMMTPRGCNVEEFDKIKEFEMLNATDSIYDL